MMPSVELLQAGDWAERLALEIALDMVTLSSRDARALVAKRLRALAERHFLEGYKLSTKEALDTIDRYYGRPNE